MLTVFYIAAAVAVVSTVMMVTRLNPVHALLYLVVSLLGVAVVFFTLGAPFIAALEAIIYAGAIMVLFVFAAMMLNLGERAAKQEREWQKPGIWVGPSILGAILLAEVIFLLSRTAAVAGPSFEVGPKQVGLALYGPYLIAVELASMLLLTALIGAYHLGRKWGKLPRPQRSIEAPSIPDRETSSGPGRFEASAPREFEALSPLAGEGVGGSGGGSC
jgi:NADH-quinone oxidoreductase subunit J